MKFRFLIIAFLLLFFVGCDDKKTQKSAPTANREVAELSENLNRTFSLNFDDNQTLSLKKTPKGYDISDKQNYIFSFFTQDCEACEIQNQILQNLLATKNDKNFKVVGLMIDTNATQSKDYAKNLGLKFQISLSEENKFFLKTLGGIEKIPYMLWVDKNGKIVADYTGLVSEEFLINELERLF